MMSADGLARRVAADALVLVDKRATAHRPAGSPQGGQFAPGKSGGGPGNAHLGPSNADKIKNAATMFGTGSKQHKQAQAKFGGKPDVRSPGDAVDKSPGGVGNVKAATRVADRLQKHADAARERSAARPTKANDSGHVSAQAQADGARSVARAKDNKTAYAFVVHADANMKQANKDGRDKTGSFIDENHRIGVVHAAGNSHGMNLAYSARVGGSYKSGKPRPGPDGN